MVDRSRFARFRFLAICANPEIGECDEHRDRGQPNTLMGSDQHSDKGRRLATRNGKSPEWADGLKQLYDAVVEEPLPDTFKDLLDKLDDSDPTDGQAGRTGAQ